MLMRLYDAHHSTDPLKPKGLILKYTGKSTYNVGDTTVHSKQKKICAKKKYLKRGCELGFSVSIAVSTAIINNNGRTFI